MERANTNEVERKIGYLNSMLTKIEGNMIKMQSEKVEIKQKLQHLQKLQTTLELEESEMELFVQ